MKPAKQTDIDELVKEAQQIAADIETTGVSLQRTLDTLAQKNQGHLFPSKSLYPSKTLWPA